MRSSPGDPWVAASAVGRDGAVREQQFLTGSTVNQSSFLDYYSSAGLTQKLAIV